MQWHCHNGPILLQKIQTLSSESIIIIHEDKFQSSKFYRSMDYTFSGQSMLWTIGWTVSYFTVYISYTGIKHALPGWPFFSNIVVALFKLLYGFTSYMWWLKVCSSSRYTIFKRGVSVLLKSCNFSSARSLDKKCNEFNCSIIDSTWLLLKYFDFDNIT